MNESTQILKVDEVGRVQTPPEKRRQVVEEFERSGMTGGQFARHIGVKYPTMMAREQAQKRECEQLAGPRGTQWLEAVVEPETAMPGDLAIEVPGGLRLRVGSPDQAAWAGQVLRVLGFGQPC
ncbi:MAG: IS66 family insertion sequence element accessory protein TnpA [Terrimicrobiaceae bacterium]